MFEDLSNYCICFLLLYIVFLPWSMHSLFFLLIGLIRYLCYQCKKTISFSLIKMFSQFIAYLVIVFVNVQ